MKLERVVYIPHLRGWIADYDDGTSCDFDYISEDQVKVWDSANVKTVVKHCKLLEKELSKKGVQYYELYCLDAGIVHNKLSTRWAVSPLEKVV